MDPNISPPQRYRADPRHYPRTQSTRQDEQKRRDPSRRESKPRDLSGQPPAHQEEERRELAMTKDHRFFHRRQAASVPKVLTVNVEIVATVDPGGNVLGQETKTQATNSPQASPPSDVAPALDAAGSAGMKAAGSLASPAAALLPAVASIPQVPAVPAVPTVALPVVPLVPSFPTDLTVPAYPFPSAQTSLGSLSPSPVPTSMSGSGLAASLIPPSNSTMPSMSLFSASTSATSGSESATTSSSASDDRFSAAVFTSSSDETSSPQASTVTSTSDADSTSYYAGGGAAGTAYPPGGPAQSTPSGASTIGSTTPLQTPQVVGSVVGSLAGAALILAIILLLLRRHKQRRQGALQLSDETTDRSPPPMIQNDPKANRISTAFLNRFSGISRSTVETSTTASGGERSFQRVSGRKLPSAFSEGMTSDQFSRGGTLSGSSFYMDDQGTYGSPGLSKEFGKGIDAAASGGGAMNIRPGPRRTPIIRHPDDKEDPFADPAPFPRANAHLTPPQSPKREARPTTLGRSLYSHDGSRSSKFTENV